MQSNEAILLVLVVILIVIVVGQKRGYSFGQSGYDGCPTGCGCPKCQKKESFGGFSGDTTLRTNQRLRDDVRRGVKHDGSGPHPYDSALVTGELHKHYPAWSQDIQDISKGETAAWIASHGSDSQENYHTGSSDTAVGTSWQESSTDIVVNPRMREQHNAWVNEIKGKSSVAMVADNMDEPSAMAAPRSGINAFRFPGVTQDKNMMQVTEQDPRSHAMHATNYQL
jgi:hypothetical protein